MNIAIYIPIKACDLLPDMVIANGDGPLVVHEVRKVVDSKTHETVVDVYGLPPKPERKQRIRRRYALTETVRLQPTDDEAYNAWGHVTNAVREAVDGWEDPEGPAPWGTIDHETAVTVQVGTTTYELAPDTTPSPPPPADPDDEF